MYRSASALFILALCACEPGGGGDDDPLTLGGGNVSGRVSPFTPGVANAGSTVIPARALEVGARIVAGRGQALLAVGPAPFTPAFRPRDFVPGEVLVRLRSDVSVVDTLHVHPGLGEWRFAPGVWGFARVLTLRVRRADGRVPGHEETARVAALLTRHPDLAYAHLNHYKRTYRKPDDEFYPFQWHYQQIGMPAAWDLTTGSTDVVCAVVDDGVNPHPDFGDRRLGGYDMISDLGFAGDGDGRDGEPSQVAGSQGGQSVWHGTHVAGTVGASANNAGLVGVDWACRILPVRVLGVVDPARGAGTSIDIIAGIAWAAGLEVPDAPANRDRAHVINLSLGGGPLVTAEQEVIDAAVGAGAIVVVAAGNDNRDAGASSLAGYENVIVVGATDYTASRAPYSNFGSVVDVMAPGGNVEADANADGYPDGVLSTYLSQDGRESIIDFLQGTSMASPHVAGLVALMKSVKPGLSAAEAERILKDTADPGARCDAGCGAGLINAPAALRAAGGVAPDAPPSLSVSAERINLGGRDSGRVMLFNAGGGDLGWRASIGGTAASAVRIRGDDEGSLGPGGSAAVEVRVDRGGMPDGTHQATLDVRSDNGEARLAVIFVVGAAPVADVGPIGVATARPDEAGNIIIGGETQTSAADGYAYALSSEPGDWLVVAVADVNRDGNLGSGDLLGFWRNPDAIEPVRLDGGALTGIDFPLVPVQGADLAEPPCADLRRCWEGCAGDQDCIQACPASGACEGCYNRTVAPCLTQTGCPGGACVCPNCGPQVDECFGPNTCGAGGGGGGGGGGGAPLGGACGGGDCAAPYECETTVPGGYCTALCDSDAACPGGACVLLDGDGDGVPDVAVCLAVCAGPGTCPRGGDTCQVIDTGAQVCVP